MEVGWKTGFAADTYHDAGPIELRIIFARGAGFCFRLVDSSVERVSGDYGRPGGRMVLEDIFFREKGGYEKREIFCWEKRT